jgi:integrase
MSNRITEKTVKHLDPPKSGNSIVYDSEIRGFGARITANGVVSFVLNYTFAGRERRYTIGRFPEWSATAARDEAIEIRKQINAGKDPLQERELARGEPLVSYLATEYLNRHAIPHKRASSLRNDRQMLENVIVPRIGKLRISAVGRRDIQRIHVALKATPYRANRVLALMSTMFGFAVDWKWRPDNPAEGVQRFHEDKRVTWLTSEQLEALERALSNYSDPNAADAIRLLILTGAREGEVIGASWDQFDLVRKVWTKPSHHTKQNKIEHVPLGDAAVALMKRIEQRRNGSVYVFPGKQNEDSAGKLTLDRARVTLRRPWVQVCRAAGLATSYVVQGKRKQLTRYRPNVRIHDLRHSFASHLVSRGESLHIVGKLLGHTEPKTTQRYAHLADGALRDAANRFANVLEEHSQSKKMPKRSNLKIVRK